MNNQPPQAENTVPGQTELPDIGADPLSLDGDERQEYGAKWLERLRSACAIQQMGVPDQTALVWRIDLSRIITALTLAEARATPSVSSRPKSEDAYQRLSRARETKRNRI